MARIRDCEVPEDCHYLVEKHVWARVMPEGHVRLGLTPVGYALLRNSVVAVELQEQWIGQAVARGQSIALVESLKYIGPLAAPFAGVLLRGNALVEADPDLAMRDPYGAGWIAEMLPDDWEAASAELLTGEEAVMSYQKLIERLNLTCD